MHLWLRAFFRGFAPLASFALAGLASVLAADLEPSRLRPILPEKWTRTQDKDTQLPCLVPPGGNAAVTFLHSTAFAGSAEEWREAVWKSLVEKGKLLGSPQSGVQGAFLTRMGVIQQPDGSRPWVCLYTLVKDRRGEAALFLAGGDREFLAHLFAANEIMHRITFAPAGAADAAPSPSASPPPPAVNSPTPKPAESPTAGNHTAVAGLYLATTRQLKLNPFGPPGSASWETGTEFYLLSNDGQVFRGRDLPNAPGGDITRFDYAAARREAPGNYGSYQVRGTEVHFQFGPPPGETLIASRSDPDALDIRGTKFKRSIPARQP